MNPLIYVFDGGGVISLMLHEGSDAAIIAVVVCNERRGGDASGGKGAEGAGFPEEADKPAGPAVSREGKEREIEASQLVPGDVVCLDAGCQIPADLRLTPDRRDEGGGNPR